MTKSKALIAVAGAAASASILLSFLAVGSAQALTCKSYSITSGYGRNLQRSVAKRNARIKWRAKVRFKPGLGWSWSDWSKSSHKFYNCGKYGKIYKKWACTARARPCK